MIIYGETRCVFVLVVSQNVSQNKDSYKQNWNWKKFMRASDYGIAENMVIQLERRSDTFLDLVQFLFSSFRSSTKLLDTKKKEPPTLDGSNFFGGSRNSSE